MTLINLRETTRPVVGRRLPPPPSPIQISEGPGGALLSCFDKSELFAFGPFPFSSFLSSTFFDVTTTSSLMSFSKPVAGDGRSTDTADRTTPGTDCERRRCHKKRERNNQNGMYNKRVQCNSSLRLNKPGLRTALVFMYFVSLTVVKM